MHTYMPNTVSNQRSQQNDNRTDGQTDRQTTPIDQKIKSVAIHNRHAEEAICM